jgi:hypothetical protein
MCHPQGVYENKGTQVQHASPVDNFGKFVYSRILIQGVRAIGIQKYMPINTWQELEYHLDICRATTGAHIEVYGRA